MSARLPEGRIVALSGGVGGAKLALGLSHVLPADRLSIVVNTADDFEHFGLWISPDLDTVTYTLAGLVNPATGWGLAGESWRFMEAMGRLGGATWFNLGDTDLATHALRTARLRAGDRLTDITRDIAMALGIGVPILPATDDRIQTMVTTDQGELAFQEYFVGRRCAPAVRSLYYDGSGAARPTPEVVAALEAEDLAALVICPSNPYLSVDPILAIPGLRERIESLGVPVVAVSPIIGGKSVKGPLAKMMADFGLDSDVRAIARHYQAIADILVVDEADREFQDPEMEVLAVPTLMTTLEDRISLASFVLEAVADRGGKAG